MQGNRERNSWALERVSENRCQKVGKPFVAEMFLGSKSHHCKSKEKSQKKERNDKQQFTVLEYITIVLRCIFLFNDVPTIQLLDF